MAPAITCLLSHLAIFCGNPQIQWSPILKTWKPLSLTPHLPNILVGRFFQRESQLKCKHLLYTMYKEITANPQMVCILGF